MKPLKALNEYVDYVKQIQNAKDTLVKLEAEKVKLEQMKAVLGKFRNKESDSSGFGGSAQIQLLQAKIETIAHTLLTRYTQLEECEEKAKTGFEENATNLVERIEEEKENEDGWYGQRYHRDL